MAGTQEPIYGPSAIRSVAEQTATVPYTELTRDDLKWVNMDSTSVETQVFYLTADSGHLAFVQVIHSNVAYVCACIPVVMATRMAAHVLTAMRVQWDPTNEPV